MKKYITLLCTLILSVMMCHAEEYQEDSDAQDNTEVEETAEDETSDNNRKLSLYSYDFLKKSPELKAENPPKYKFFKSVPVEKPYKFMDDQTFVGIPLFAAGLLIKSQKKYFRQNIDDPDPLRAKDRLVKSFKTEIDNYTQYAPIALATGLKLAGVDGRSDWGRYLASAAMSYGIMAALVNGVKYTAKEMRPDGTSANSFPSGHTATAFVGATILHKEYGLTHSPWYSIGGYALATATGVMRVLNNRHWVSDVLAGAGIGIFSTELAYGLTDIIFKGKGLRRTDIETGNFITTNPTFFSIDVGVGFGNRNLDFQLVNEEKNINECVAFRFKPSTVVGAEGAYFFNKHIGVGGRLRVRSTPVDGFDDIIGNVRHNVSEFAKESEWANYKPIDESRSNVTIESDHLTEFTANLGLFLNLPLSKRFALGAKFLVGRSILADLDLDLSMAGNTIVADEHGNYKTGEEYNVKWDIINVAGNNSMTYGTGVSVTYAYKSTFSWRVFVDYDYARKNFTLTYDPLHFIPEMFPDFSKQVYSDIEPVKATTKKNLSQLTVGGSFCVSF